MDPTQPDPPMTENFVTQPDPWMDPTRVQLWVWFKSGMEERGSDGVMVVTDDERDWRNGAGRLFERLGHNSAITERAICDFERGSWGWMSDGDDREPTQYSMPSRLHTKELIQKTSNLNNCHFLIRLLYKDCY